MNYEPLVNVQSSIFYDHLLLHNLVTELWNSLRLLDRRNYLLTQIEEVRRTRAVQRAGRKRQGGSSAQRLATVAVVGYTNAVSRISIYVFAIYCN